MCTFNHAVTLGVKGCCSVVVDPQPLADLLPYGQGKLCASVCGNNSRHTLTAHPGMDKSLHTNRVHYVTQRHSLQPSSGTNSHREEVCLTFGCNRKWPHNIHVYVAKPPGGHRNGLDSRRWLFGNFTMAGGLAVTDPFVNIFFHASPYNTPREKASGSMCTHMGQFMNRQKYHSPVTHRNHWQGHTPGHIT